MKIHLQKNTLLKNAPANAEGNFFKKVFSSPTLQCFNFFSNRSVHDRTDISLNVNRFEQSVCKLDTTALRTDSRASGNKGFKEMAGEVLNQTVVLLIKCSVRLTVCASKSATS